MIAFKALSKEEQLVFLAIEKQFINRPNLLRKDFVKVLDMLIQKYTFEGILSGGNKNGNSK
jgi:hypothetical protein